MFRADVIVCNSLVDPPNILYLDPDPEYCPNLELDPDPRDLLNSFHTSNFKKAVKKKFLKQFILFKNL